MLDKKIFFYGAGVMAEGIIGGLLRGKVAAADNIYVCNRTPARREYLRRKYGVRPVAGRDGLTDGQPDKASDGSPEALFEGLAEALAASRIVLLAVRPQEAGQVLPILMHYAGPDSLIVSICAGLTLARLEEALGGARRICKAMPNTLIESGRGYSAVTLNRNISAADKSDLELLFNSIGRTMFLPEDMFDAFTAFSCAGPAYIMQCLDAFIEAGVQSGFSAADARRIVLENFIGSTLVLQNSDKHPAQICEAMSSPAGVTIEGLYELHSAGLHGTIMRCVRRALARARELAG